MKRKITVALFAIMMVLAMIPALVIGVSAEEATYLTLPEINIPVKPYPTTEKFNIPLDELNALLPKEIEVKHENGKAMIKDFGAFSVLSYYKDEFVNMELVDGWWTYEVPEEEFESFIELVNVYGQDEYWRVAFHSGVSDRWLYINTESANIAIQLEIGSVQVLYYGNDVSYEDYYDNGVLAYHRVKGYYNDTFTEVEYDYSGNIINLAVSTDTWHYYLPDVGWVNNLYTKEPIDAPAGMENINDDIIKEHFPYGSFPSDLIVIPEFECPTRPYATKSELNIPIDDIVALFPQEVEIKYENGKAMFKDFGAARVESAVAWPLPQMELVDGWWTYDVAEEEYEDFVKQINVYGKDDSWDLSYFDGKADPWLDIYFGNDCVSISLNSKAVDVWYNLDGTQYRDTYSNEGLDCHCVIAYLNDGNEVQVEYDFSGKVIYMRMLSFEGIWYYYVPDTGWTSDLSPNETVELPEPYNNYTLGQFMELAPALGLCEHEWVDATCQMTKNCEKCGLWDGEVSDHDYADATCESPKICTVCGETVGEALGHSFADATCDTPKTCTVCGETEGEAHGHDFADATCETPKTCGTCGETEGEALGHDFADATTEAPKTCKNCGKTEGEKLPTPTEPIIPEVPETPEEPEETNWFLKIIKAIVDFFRNLFGIKTGK